MNPDPASPDHNVPSQSKTATAGDKTRTASRNSCVLKRLTATTLLTNLTSFSARRPLRASILRLEIAFILSRELYKQIISRAQAKILGDLVRYGPSAKHQKI
jgi:hypothetical protein